MLGICLSSGAKWEDPQEGAWLAGIGRLHSHYKGCGDCGIVLEEPLRRKESASFSRTSKLSSSL